MAEQALSEKKMHNQEAMEFSCYCPGVDRKPTIMDYDEEIGNFIITPLKALRTALWGIIKRDEVENPDEVDAIVHTMWVMELNFKSLSKYFRKASMHNEKEPDAA